MNRPSRAGPPISARNVSTPTALRHTGHLDAGTPEHLASWTDRQAAYGYHHRSDNDCPRLLVGKRCLTVDCWCTSRLNANAATYTRHRQAVVLWEPYHADPAELARVAAQAEGDGLDVSVSGASPWNPGSTLAIVFRVLPAPTAPGHLPPLASRRST